MGIIGEKLATNLVVGDAIALQNQSAPKGYSVHVIERIERDAFGIVLFGSNLLEIVLQHDQPVSVAGKTRNRWSHDHVPIARRIFRRLRNNVTAAEAAAIFAWSRSERQRRLATSS